LQVSLSASLLVAGGIPRLAAHGTPGSWIKHGLDVQEDQLRAGMLPGDPAWGVDPRPARLHGDGGVARQCSLPVGDYPRYYRGVRDAILGLGPNPVPPAESVATLAVLETASEAARLGRVLSLPLTEGERGAFAQASAATVPA
jgi:hypothetical protein